MTHYHPCEDRDCAAKHPDWISLDASSWVYTDYRWLNRRTGEPQTVLHPRHDPHDWVRQMRDVIKLRGEWSVIN